MSEGIYKAIEIGKFVQVADLLPLVLAYPVADRIMRLILTVLVGIPSS